VLDSHDIVNVSGIHSKNLVAILHLLVTLARFYRAPIRLPENVIINVIVVQVRSACAFRLVVVLICFVIRLSLPQLSSIQVTDGP